MAGAGLRHYGCPCCFKSTVRSTKSLYNVDPFFKKKKESPKPIYTSTWETCLAGKTNLPVNVRAESQKIAVWIYTALPCTTPRPAPKSSTDDLAWDLWARPPPKRRPYFGWVSRGGVSRSLTDHSSPTPRRPRLKNKQHRPGIRPTDERPEPSTARRTLFSNRDGSRYGHPDNKKPHASVSLPSSSIDSTFRGLQV